MGVTIGLICSFRAYDIIFFYRQVKYFTIYEGEQNDQRAILMIKHTVHKPTKINITQLGSIFIGGWMGDECCLLPSPSRMCNAKKKTMKSSLILSVKHTQPMLMYFIKHLYSELVWSHTKYFRFTYGQQATHFLL